jgi:two-component system, OmpR family, phosphate regulon response regulator PhoB
MQTATVLIVDDEPSIVQLVRLTLESARLRIFEAPDGAVALARALAVHPDLVLLDVDLPDVDGLEVCRRLRAEPELKHAKVVMLTAAAQQEEVARGYAAGADQYLTKPFSPLRLLTLVAQLMPTTCPCRPA